MPFETSVPDPIPEPEAARKKPRRLWLFAPYAVLALLLLGWGAYWFVARTTLERGLDAQAEALRGAGYVVELGDRRVEGFPFRMKIHLADARIAAPSGWAISAPGLTGEAYLHGLDHWVLVAPQGLNITRPEGGGLAVRGEALRASIAGVSKAPWRIVLQGTKLVFTPDAGARPFSLAAADRLEFYLKPMPSGADGAALLILQGGKATPGTVLQRLAGDGVVAASLDARLIHPEAFHGQDWGAAVRSWAAAGGTATDVEGVVSGGPATARAKGGTLGAGSDGRLVGAIPLELNRAAPTLSALADANALDASAASSAAAVAAARAQGQASTLNLVFQAGATTLGPVRIGPAPKVG
jgi:hypothetical protein